MDEKSPQKERVIQTNTIVEVKRLTYTYPRRKTRILDDLSVNISANELVALVGKTGSGKTTLALCLNGLIPHVVGGKVEGSVSIGGLSPLTERVGLMATVIGLAFQDPEAQLFNLYVEDELAFGCENLCVPREEISRRVKQFSELLGLSSFREGFCSNLSTGQKHKVAIASIIAMKPKLLVLDEPLADLDPLSALDFLACIEKLRLKEDLAVLVMEHKIDDLAARADRIIVLDGGRIIAEGHPREVLEEHGQYMLSHLGIRIPQIVELAIALKGRGVSLKPLPLTPKEAFDVISRFHPHFTSPPIEDPEEKGKTELEIQELSFAYVHGGREILKDVDLEIRSGEFVALVGANAAGKTTLAKNMVGLLKPDKGRVLLHGEDIRKIPSASIVKRVGYVFQRPECQFVRETVQDDISFSVDISKESHPESEKVAANLLERFGLKDHLNAPVDTLSRGQKRRLGIISMLTLGQRVIILDEPTTGQDWRATTTLMKLLKTLSKETRLTVIIITHDMRVVAEWAERVLVMRQGEIQFDGRTKDLFANPSLLKESSLAVPPIVELSDLFCQDGASHCFPHLTIEEFVNSVEFDT